MKQATPTPSGPSFQTLKEVESHAKARMEKVLADLQHEMAAVRTGRASVSLLAPVRVRRPSAPRGSG
jgi:ribosome recycling factor